MKNYLAIMLFLMISACALLPDKSKTPEAPATVGQPQARPQAGIEAKQLAAEQEADALAEIVFERGKSVLSLNEAARLKSVEERLSKSPYSGRIVIAAWADQSAPGAERKSLDQAAVQLAKARGDVLQKRFLKMGARDIEFHNMAERPTGLAKFLSAEDARIKKSLEGARPSRAVVLLIQGSKKKAGEN